MTDIQWSSQPEQREVERSIEKDFSTTLHPIAIGSARNDGSMREFLLVD
jgi:hypothetical protein